MDVRAVGHGDEHAVGHGVPMHWGMETDVQWGTELCVRGGRRQCTGSGTPWEGGVCVGSEWARGAADAGQKAVCVQGAAEMDSLQRRGCVSSGASGCAEDASTGVCEARSTLWGRELA